MALISLAQGLAHAQQQGYALGAFNVLDSHFLRALFDAAERQRSPFIINIAEVHFKYVTLDQITEAIRFEAAKHTVPVVLNLDHGLHFEAVMQAIRLGFTSVMFDGSTLSYEENIRQTREVVRAAHAVGVSVEAELGAVGVMKAAYCLGSGQREFTDPRLAAEFVRETGIDTLAVAIGNAHGKYKGNPNWILTGWRRFVSKPVYRWCCTAGRASATRISVGQSHSVSTKLTFTPACLRRPLTRWNAVWPRAIPVMMSSQSY